jgi:alpha-methylacyl-CoA racemase
MSEAAEHPHNVERNTFIDIAGTTQPAPAPRFSRTVPEVSMPPAFAGTHTREVLAEWGVGVELIDSWESSGGIKQAEPAAG